ncbi:NAD-glutamate dehydrogenase [Gordonia sp. ABSL1-1]|uniref:NAD-glutamate dehydrogenase n=1 Tax=Gordonia sp. ABSL1-1 TaxID=3053923 RepID=UPI0025735D64|nr:NAD-glutamate dehydrogenase [Gordonia sp. ABSL1-1]MDL9938536.1 NAD-glutamate dehydrogenase [Gordonia sp. ABSL1-1]
MTSLLPEAVNRYFTDRVDQSAATDDVAADVVLSHLDAASPRHVGDALIKVVVSDTGLVDIMVVVDDMPLLVEAVLATVEAHGLTVEQMHHPLLPAHRDDDGHLRDIADTQAGIWESWILVEALSARSDVDADRLRSGLHEVVRRVGDVDHDASAMRAQLDICAADLARIPADASTGLTDADRAEYAELLNWLSVNHFHVLGYLRTPAARTPDSDAAEPGTDALGVWRADAVRRDFRPDQHEPLVPRISRVFLQTGIQRSDFPVMLSVPIIDADGSYRGDHRFLGVFTSSGLHQAVLDVPVIRGRVATLMRQSGVDEDSYAGQATLQLLQNYPLAEMFATSDTELGRRVHTTLDAVATRSLRLFVRPDPDGHTAVALIYLPRDRYNTVARVALQDALVTQLGGRDLEYTARVSELPLALLQVIVHIDRDVALRLGSLHTGSSALAAMQDALDDAIRGWPERLRQLAADPGTGIADADRDRLLREIPALSEDYKEQRAPEDALNDLRNILHLAPGEIAVTLDSDDDHDEIADTRWVFTLYLCGASATLTDVLPVLGSLGLDVLDEHPYEIHRSDGTVCWAYAFSVQLTAGMSVDDAGIADLEHRFTEAFTRIWLGQAEVDAFNELVIRCGLDWRSAAMLRAYGRYLRQCGFSYSTSHVAEVLGEYRAVTRGLVDLFGASFDPAAADEDRRAEAERRLRADIGAVLGLDADRVVSAFAAVLTATARTNYFVRDADGADLPVISFKLRPRDIPLTPEPRPLHEIFVYSPRVEGVHLRFGAVARGGLRWSDRREDFRTEILGLVKAQAVKNAVIVPLGAKGGFVVKNPPTPTGDGAADRDAARAEGVACYRQFIAGLLDVTDNIDRRTGAVLPARGVVRRDADDTYLVVAADKGTAAFSDIANDVAAHYDFWLGDGFASGGSAGYDHKEMGITARGAWESVKRHFREMGVDTQSQDFTVVGIGDMSGDVFGNGMLLSEHIRLVAAFDHRHVFVDPNPDAARSYTERARLFELARSSWADYDPQLISMGGGVFARDQKSIPISPEMAAALGIDGTVAELSPPELIRAVLLAPVDLLWNGGIGTYVKSSTESHGEVGDKSNDAIRVDGEQLRAKVVGEGGNLGVTERGRVEYDLAGGRINTDAMDNSAGVDCSDHEVNIKILLDSVVSTGELAAAERNPLLESMTDEVGDLVLADNISQNAELGFSRTYAMARIDVHARMLNQMSREYGVDLRLEALPEPLELRKRFAGELHRGLTSPELATLLAHVKLQAKADLLAGDLPDNDVFQRRLADYFPQPLRTKYAEAIRSHRLRREIVATTLVNDVVEQGGVTHLYRLGEGSGCTTDEAVRAYVVTDRVFGLDDLFARIRHTAAPSAVIDEMMLYARRLLFRSSRWMIGFRPQPQAIAAETTRYGGRIGDLSTHMSEWFGASTIRDVDGRAAHYRERGVPDDLAYDVAVSLHRFCLLDIIDVADIAERDAVEVGALYFAVMEHFGLEELLTAVSNLDFGDRWHALARLALRDDMHGALRALTMTVLEVSEPDETPAEKIAEWELSQSSRLSRVRTVLAEIEESGMTDLATLSVAARQLRSMIR